MYPTLVKLDKKWRIRLPKKAREAMGLTGKEMLEVDLEDGKLLIMKPSKKLQRLSPFMRDIIERPLKTKMVITTEMINKAKRERWEQWT